MKKIITLIVLLSVTAHAKDAAIKINGGQISTNGVEMVLLPMPGSFYDPNEFILVFRNAKTKELVGADTIEQFGGKFTATDLPIKTVLWSPNGDYVAFDLRTERHYTRIFIYKIKDGISQITLPDYWNEIKKQIDSTAEFRGGGQRPIRWIDNTHIELSEEGTMRDFKEYGLKVTLQIAGTNAVFIDVKKEDDKN